MKYFMLIGVVVALCALSVNAADLIDQADSFSSARGKNFDPETMTVDPSNIQQAIELYQKAFEQLSGSDREEACWKLMASCYFMGQYAETDSDRKKEVYDLGKNIGTEGLEAFPESVGIHAWMAIIWGVWGEENGIFQSARQGVAGKIREHCEKVIELDDHFHDATGYRVLGRVNFKAPKIPIILGWPSKDKAVELLENAYQIAPHNLYTIQYLAEAYHERGRKDHAEQLLRELLATPKTIHGVVEDAFIKHDAEMLLQEWN